MVVGLNLVTVGASAEPERIHGYHSHIVVRQDGSMAVTETIIVTAGGDKIKRGIYRDFPTLYQGRWGTRVEVPFYVSCVLRDGHAEPFHTAPQKNGIRIYIGSEDVYLKPGRYTYTIEYTTDRQLGFFDDHDELYWNVTGNGWEFPIASATATVELPDGIPPNKIRMEGYTGPQGSRAKCLTFSVDQQSGRVTFATTRPLGRYEGLTIVVGFPKGYVPEPSTSEQIRRFLAGNMCLLVGTIGIVVLLGYYVFAWINVGHDPWQGTIIPLFEPPLRLAPAAMRYIHRMAYDRKCFAAALLSMAVKGFVHITEQDGEYTLQRTKGRHTKGETSLSPGEKRIAQKLLAGKKSTIKLVSSNHSAINKAIAELKSFLDLEYNGKMFQLNRKWLIPGVVLSLVGLLVAGLAGSGFGERTFLFLFMCVWLSGWTVGVAFLTVATLAAWWAAISERKNVAKKAGSLGIAVFITLFSLPFFAGEGIGLWFLMDATSVWIVPLFLVVAAINVLFFFLIQRPTVAGRKLMDQIDGFRMYLSTAEGHYLNEIHPPHRTPELLERYLPYAVALGVENQWAEQFADVLAGAEQADGAGGYRPGWYEGPAWDSGSFDSFAGTFSGFMVGLGSSLGNAVASSATAPGSVSGFSSGGGAGGGGCSGGGGGGGGGGGW
ncbi:MAG: DUF2207 domain-containing protein [Pirellulales bacterium]|nr:DUF2207 domain-containing protein [Pirellulales bacterium]